MSIVFPKGLIAIEDAPGYVWDLEFKTVFSYKSGLLKEIKRKKYKQHDGYQLSVNGRHVFRYHDKLVKRYSSGNLKYKDAIQEVNFESLESKDLFESDVKTLSSEDIVARLSETFDADQQGSIYQYQFVESARGRLKLRYTLMPSDTLPW